MINIKCSVHGNFGDKVTNTYIMNKISGQTVQIIAMQKQDVENCCLGCGSILRWATSKDIVWGSGYMRLSDECIGKPKKIYAVRGKLTRQLLLKQNIKCPEIYGDPALLYPRFYYPKIEKKYKLGIIPHYIDIRNKNRNVDRLKQLNDKNTLFIDIMSGYENVIKQVLSCEKIVSSALHGVIIADAYDIPVMWIKFSDDVLGKGFKFRDYFSSVNRKDKEAFVITDKTNIEDIHKIFYDYKIQIDLNKLYNSCPFMIYKGEVK